MGGKIDHAKNNGCGPYTFVLSGLNYHHIGSLLPENGAKPVYSQLYIYDTENEVENRISAVSSMISRPHPHGFKLRLISNRQHDGRTHNLPSASEVARLIIGDIDINFQRRDVIVEELSGAPQRIHELHPSYLPLQYPLLFPWERTVTGTI
ncbi:hypothetical protein K1719_022333 [Acacia pycnantha]|nr:hypothetical protein K1719_022333 [Acacia pycnantha]